MKNPFSYQSLTKEQAEDIELIRSTFQAVAEKVESVKSDNDPRYLAIFKTKLEEALMFAVKSISHYEGKLP